MNVFTVSSSGYIYVPQSNALTIINGSDPTHLEVVNEIPLEVELNFLATTGNRLVALSNSDIIVYDITTPTDPKVIGYFPSYPSGQDNVQFSLFNNTVYMSLNGQTTAFDITSEPRPLWKFFSGGKMILFYLI
jgi:hypothetical protein